MHYSNSRVAIILVNYNGYKDTVECLQSLNKQVYTNFVVYLVDNCSTDNSQVYLENYIDQRNENYEIRYIKSKVNTGFAGGNNVAITEILASHAFDYIWLLNNDTEVAKDAMSSLVTVLDNNNSIGIVGSKIYYYDTNKLWFCGGLINNKTGKTKHIGFGEIESGKYDGTYEVDYITGCSLMIKTAVVKTIGLIPENYFLYYEETDWNLKCKKNGFKIVYCSESVVFHKISSSSGGIKNPNPFVIYYKLRNRILFIKRHYKINIEFLLHLFVDILKQILKTFTFNNKLIRLKYIMRSISDGMLGKDGKHPKLD